MPIVSGGREGGKEGGREGGKEGGREGRRERGREIGRLKGGKEGGSLDNQKTPPYTEHTCRHVAKLYSYHSHCSPTIVVHVKAQHVDKGYRSACARRPLL